MEKKIKIVTHNAGFHTDDVFGVATLLLLLGEENCEVVRTRDPEIIKTGDYVLDVGHEYVPDQNRFDHHQTGRAGERNNGVRYASFGLVWKKFGEELCNGSQEVADRVDKKLVQPIDAFDNGQPLYRALEIEEVRPYSIDRIIDSFYPKADSQAEVMDERFFEVVLIAKRILRNEIAIEKIHVDDEREIQEIYENAIDKKILVFDKYYKWREKVKTFPETLFVIGPRFSEDENRNWAVITVQDNYPESFEMRKGLPKAWRGKQHQDLVKASGVSDAVFCHDSGFIASAASKEGALKLARLALEA